MGASKRPPTAFERKVYAALREIPRGRVVTYASLAKRLQCCSTQAVGQALRRNPFAPGVPCHRVIRSDGSLGGYSGKRRGIQVHRKQLILAAESVQFDGEGRLCDPNLLWNWEE
ncbi:MAG: methyltransferase [Verrucomicrobiaceae bacterium]|nr:methyltransferase [Verrucomicrobiaceae bacterium]